MKYPYEVRIPASKDPDFGHQTIEWLAQRSRFPERDYEIDMHGGKIGYTSFWFKDAKLAVYTKLVRG